MIARRVESHGWLIIRIGQNHPKTPQIPSYQSKMT
jgi:hypothetical protein